VKTFLARHAGDITGVLSFWDRLVFRGVLKKIAYVAGMDLYLSMSGVLFKGFGTFALRCSEKLKAASLAIAEREGRPVEYLASGGTDKEAFARGIAVRDRIEAGLVAVLTCVEPCRAYDIHRNAKTKFLELVRRPRKCLHLYFYLIDPVFGWLNARIQTWFPFDVQVCVNGREWLSRKLDKAGVGYVRQDNCFTHLTDPAKAGQIAKKEFQRDWPRLLGRIAAMLNPAHEEIFGRFNVGYYWTAYQSEWATDVMFRDAAALAPVASAMMRQAISSFSCKDVMKFLHPQASGRFQGELVTDFTNRCEGRRVKFFVGQNSVKFYDKQASVARVETTIQNPKPFKVMRPKEGGTSDDIQLRPMRKGVADLYQRAEVSQGVNERLLEAFAAADAGDRLGTVLTESAKPVKWKTRTVRGLRAWDPAEIQFCRALNDGRFVLSGIRNRDLQSLLYKSPADSNSEKRHRAASVTRRLRMMRAHGVLQKIPSTHRYKVTKAGRIFLTALLQAQEVTLDKLAGVSA
jgi:hypothetical protein